MVGFERARDPHVSRMIAKIAINVVSIQQRANVFAFVKAAQTANAPRQGRQGR
jgi:hypothetical protein